MANPSKDVAVSAGRGVVLITGAKLWFIAAGYASVFVLPRLLDQAAYGVYGTVVAVVSIINNVLITGTIQAVSKFTAEDDARAPAVLRTALGIQLVVGLVVAGAYFGLSPWLATSFLRKPSLVPYLWLSAVIVFAYALYPALVGSLNGRKLFQRQAALDITFSTLRTGLTLGLAAAGLGVFGAVGGFSAAAGIVLFIALAWVGIGKAGGGFPPARYLAFVAPIFGFHLLLNSVLLLDVVLLSRAASLTAEASGVARAAAEAGANEQVGAYRAMQQVAFIPYQLILSVAFVVFPLVSRATFDKDVESTRAYVRGALRFALLLCAGMAAVFAARPAGIVAILFPAEYGYGAPAFAVLAGGVVAFALFVLVCTILNGAGRAKTSAILAGVSLAAVVGLNLSLVPGREGVAALVACAVSTSGGMLVGLVASAFVLLRTVGAFLPAVTLVRSVAAAAVVIAVGRMLPPTGKIVTLGLLAGLFLLYAVILAVTRELGADDFGKLRRIVRGR